MFIRVLMILLILCGYLCLAFAVSNNTVTYNGKVLKAGEKINFVRPRKYDKHLMIDGFIFNGEPMIQLRMNYLEDVVDLMVVVEGLHTHTGHLKPDFPINTNYGWFKDAMDQGRMIRISINVFPVDIGTDIVPDKIDEYLRERYHRNVIQEVLFEHLPETETYVLMSMDGDEIPRKESVQKYATMYDQLDYGMKLRMMFFYYSFQWMKKGTWVKAAVCNDKFLRANSETILNDLRVFGLDKCKGSEGTGLDRCITAEDEGWHCSYFLSPADILKKITTFADHKAIMQHGISEKWIAECVTEGLDLYHREAQNPGEALIPYDGKRGLPSCKKCYLYRDFGLA